MSNFITSNSGPLKGSIKVPGDKSISHRSIMLGSIADGITRVSGILEGDDSLATLNAFKDMGVQIERDGSHVIIHGVGMKGLEEPKNPLYLGNSGTSIRLMSGLLSAQNFNSKLLKKFKILQLPISYKKKKSHFIIKNDFTKKSVKKGIKNILREII